MKNTNRITYLNPYSSRKIIYKENLNKVGIYRWIHINSGNSYIGSSINITNRLRCYLSKSFLITELTKKNSHIYKALLKYGYSSFKLEILEYCSITEILNREQYYLNNLLPEYNILKVVRSHKNLKKKLK